MPTYVIVLLVWVDDIIICSNCETELLKFKNFLSITFKMKDLGVLSWFLGIKFEFKNNYVRMSQTSFLKKVLERFNMSQSNPKLLPCAPNENKFNNESSKLLDDPRLYREIVGSVIYAMSCTRPDLSFIVTKLSQYLSKPTEAHLNLAKNVLRYIKGTVDYNLTYTRSDSPLKLIGFCDSDWANGEDRKSISGYCFKLAENSALISWKSKKQNTVSLSTCEAEYVAITHAIKEGKFLQQVFSDINNSQKCMFNLNCDNQGALKLAYNPIHHERSKHIDIKYHFIRSEMEKSVRLNYIPTNDNISDMFTKALSKAKLNSFNIRGY